MKKATQLTVNERKQRAKLKMNFQVTSNSQAKKLADSANIRSELYNGVSDIIPHSYFTEFMEAKRKKHKRECVESVPTLLECAENFKDSCDPELQPQLLPDTFTNSLFFIEDQVKLVYEKTIGQFNYKEWKRQRTGRITASRFKEIYSCAERLYSGEVDEHPSALIASIMGYSEYVQTWQMKHGLNTEVHAKAKFKQIFKKLHKNCTFKDPGMTICEIIPLISVSPDLEVCCS